MPFGFCFVLRALRQHTVKMTAHIELINNNSKVDTIHQNTWYLLPYPATTWRTRVIRAKLGKVSGKKRGKIYFL